MGGRATKVQFCKAPKIKAKPNILSRIAVLPGSQRCRALATEFYPGPLQNMCFTRFELLGPQTRRVFQCLRRVDCENRTSIPNQLKTIHFGTRSLFDLDPTSTAPLPQTGLLDPCRSCVLRVLTSWGLKHVVFSSGVMAPMGKLVTCLERLDRPNRTRMVLFSAHGSIIDSLPSHLKSSLFQRLLWLGPQNVTGRRLGCPTARV